MRCAWWKTPAELASSLQSLFADDAARDAMSANARRLLDQGRGALERTITLIEPALPRA